jgi:hypothetical protein
MRRGRNELAFKTAYSFISSWPEGGAMVLGSVTSVCTSVRTYATLFVCPNRNF